MADSTVGALRPTPPQRRHAVVAVVGAVVFVLAALGAYFSTPPSELVLADLWDALLFLAFAVVVLLLLYLWGLRRIVRSEFPLLRALVVITVFFAGFVLLLAYAYLSLEVRSPGQVPGIETHMDALYFTVTVVTTVGFGDITPAGQAARALVTFQMVFTLVFLGALLRTAVSVGRSERDRRRQPEQGTDAAGRA